MKLVTACLAACAFIDISNGVSTKMDFGEGDSTYVVTNSSQTEDEDVEVKHTIVVSTKLKNNNRRGLQNNNNGDAGTLTYNIGQRANPRKDDSGEVPIVNGYKAVETTRIRTPDSRHKTRIYPDSVFINRNIRDDYDTYPNVAINPMQWKPSNFYNNINWRNPDSARDLYNVERKRPNYQSPGKFHRKITEDGMKEFYCRKCIEYSNGQGLKGCVGTPVTIVQQRSVSPWSLETTTPKMKIDGKLAKLN